MRLRTRDLLARLHLSLAPDAQMEQLSAAHGAARAGRARARVRLPRPRARRADDGADVGRSRSSLPRARRPAPPRRDDPLRVASAAGGLSALRPHDGPARRPVRGHVRSRGALRVSEPEPEPRTANPELRTPNHDRDPESIVRAMVGRDLPARAKHSAPGGHRAGAARPRPQPGAGRRRREPGRASRRDRRRLWSRGLGPIGAARDDLRTARAATAARCSSARRACRGGSVLGATRAGVALVPEDRQRQALLFNLALRHNLVLPRATTSRSIVDARRRGARVQQRPPADAGTSRRRASRRRPTG